MMTYASWLNEDCLWETNMLNIFSCLEKSYLCFLNHMTSCKACPLECEDASSPRL